MSFVVGKSRESRKRGRKRRRDVSTPVYRCFIGVFSLLSSPTFHSLVSRISLYRSYFRGGQLRATLLEPFPSQTPDKRRRSAPRRRNLNFSRACKCRWNDALRGRGDHTEVDNILSTRLMRIDVINFAEEGRSGLIALANTSCCEHVTFRRKYVEPLFSTTSTNLKDTAAIWLRNLGISSSRRRLGCLWDVCSCYGNSEGGMFRKWNGV